MKGPSRRKPSSSRDREIQKRGGGIGTSKIRGEVREELRADRRSLPIIEREGLMVGLERIWTAEKKAAVKREMEDEYNGKEGHEGFVTRLA